MEIQKININKIPYQGNKQIPSNRLLRNRMLTDTFEHSEIKLALPKFEHLQAYFFNKDNVDFSKLFRTGEHKKLYDNIIKPFRENVASSVELIKHFEKIFETPEFNPYEKPFNDSVFNILAFIYATDCAAFPAQNLLEYNPMKYHRIYRTIGEEEYRALLRGEYITAPSCNNESVMVTNRPTGVNACTHSRNAYFVHFKDLPNLDPLGNSFFQLSENQIPYISPHNAENAEYYLNGGYNIKDVEIIKNFIDKKIVYRSK